MKMKLLIWWLVIVFQVSGTLPLNITPDTNLKEFISNVEELVLETTDSALLVTINVYKDILETMTPLMRSATESIIEEYLQSAQHSLKCENNYADKRKLLRHFRYNNSQIERLRLEWQPQHPKFEFQLISNDFYYNGKNSTVFDNLYLNFMEQFQRESQKLWDSLSEVVVEQQQELLEILDDISNEKKLSEKDKLYDEFIELYLFKSDADEVENRELE